MAEAPTVSVELKPPPGQTAVSNETAGETDVVTFGGQVTPANAAEISASIRFEAANGQRCKGFGPGKAQDLPVGIQLSWDETTGQISGSRQLPGMGPDAEFPTCHGGRIILTVVARDPGPGGHDTTAKSAPVPIDLVGPSFREARLTAIDTVKVLFSEPVHLKSQPDSPADWEVNGLPAVGISGSGAERTLTIAPSQDEDATPSVNYLGPTRKIEGRETYLDASANNSYAGQDEQGGSSFQTARDFVPPRIPQIDQVAGTAGRSAVSNDPTPEIRVSNIRPGHWAEIYREANGQAGLQLPGDSFAGEDQADGSGAQVNVLDLGSDGRYTLYAVARDNALCDPENQGGAICPNWSGTNSGATATYTLDRIAPAPLFAAVTNVNEVTVGFSEDVVGSNNASNWIITGAAVTNVTGAGDRRTLTANGATPGASITYVPGNYADEAGNALPGFTTSLLDQLPPIVEFTDPAFDTYVQSTTYDIKGTAEAATGVEIYRDNDGNGVPDTGSPIATAPVSGDSWSANVPLSPDATNRFVARGTRTGVQGPNVRLDAALVQDSQNPSLSLGQFEAAYRGELQVDINWSASDANFGSGPMTLEFSPDGGTTWELIQAFYPNDPPYDERSQDGGWKTPLINTKNAQIRVTATDRSGRSSTATSNAFEIDSLPPLFLSRMLDARRILLDFTEGVNGLFAPLEWKIGDDQAGQIDPAGPNSGVNRATLTAGPLAPDMDPNAPPKVSYGSVSPLPETTQLVDHVGWPLIRGNRVAPSQPPPPPGDGEFGGGGAICTIIGTEGADSLFGTDGSDVICPLGGNDKIEAFGGDDIIVGGPGVKIVDGGAGNDEVNGGPLADVLKGGPGNDFIRGYGGDDQLDGSDGDDTLHGDTGNDDIKAGPGVDILEGHAGNDHLSGGSETDYLEGSGGNDSMGGGDGDDRLNGHAGNDKLRGDDGDDLLDGGEGADTVDGGDGNDIVDGTNGADSLFGSDGKDRLTGGADNDKMSGGKGRDTLLGQKGRDTLAGNRGKDRLKGGGGKDLLKGGGGRRDFCAGGGGRDRKLSCERGPKS